MGELRAVIRMTLELHSSQTLYQYTFASSERTDEPCVIRGWLLILDDFKAKVVDLCEMLIPRDQFQIELKGNGGDPNVIIRDWPPFSFQFKFQLAIIIGCFRIDRQDNVLFHKISDNG
jgi:hypothetical protein